MSQADRIQPAKISWTFHHDAQHMRDYLISGQWLTDSVEIKNNIRRTVYRTTPADSSLSALYIKYDHPPGMRDRIKSLWRCKSKVEYTIGDQLCQAGVNAAPVVAWGKRGVDSWLATKAIDDVQPLSKVWKEKRNEADYRGAIVQGMAELFEQLNKAHVRHNDLHWDNVLVRIEADSSQAGRAGMFLVDNYEARLLPNDPAAGMYSAVTLLVRMLVEIRSDEVSMLQQALAIDDWANDAEKVWRDAIDSVCRSKIHISRHRTAKMLNNSKLCRIQETQGDRWLIDREAGVDENELNDALVAVRQTDVETLTLSGMCFDVVRYQADDSSSVHHDAHKRWLHAMQIHPPHVKIARHVAWLKRKDGGGAFIVEHVGELTLGQVLQQCFDSGDMDSDVVQLALTQAAQCAARLARVGVVVPAGFHQMVRCETVANEGYVIAIPDATRATFSGRKAAEMGLGVLRSLASSLMTMPNVGQTQQHYFQLMEQAYQLELGNSIAGGLA